jgi:hypothetical protein
MTISRSSPRRVLAASMLVASMLGALALVAGCSDEQRRDLGEEDTRVALQDRVTAALDDAGLTLDGDLDCTADIGTDDAVTTSCTGTTTSAAAIVASFAGTADVDAETCTAQLVIELDGAPVVDESGVDCFAAS